MRSDEKEEIDEKIYYINCSIAILGVSVVALVFWSTLSPLYWADELIKDRETEKNVREYVKLIAIDVMQNPDYRKR